MILGTRGSPLATGQTGWVRDRLLQAHAGIVIDVRIIRTTGDRQQQAPPEAMFGSNPAVSDKGIFVKEIEEAMLAGEIDAAVHSLKDLPTEQPDGLAVVAYPPREDPRDVLVTRDGLLFADLPAGSRVGTGSPRRAAQLRALRGDLSFVPVRGNVDTRIRKMAEGQFDGVILAAAGIRRLGLIDPSGRLLDGSGTVRPLSPDECLPAVGQGALAIETRADDEAHRGIVAAINHPPTQAEVGAERAFLAALGGGCRVPVAALARAGEPGTTTLTLRGLVASPDGSTVISVTGEGTCAGAVDLGRRLASQALERGAAALLSTPAQ